MRRSPARIDLVRLVRIGSYLSMYLSHSLGFSIHGDFQSELHTLDIVDLLHMVRENSRIGLWIVDDMCACARTTPPADAQM